MTSSVSSSDTKLDGTAEATAARESPSLPIQISGQGSRQLDAGDVEKRSSRSSGEPHLAPTQTHDPDYEVSWDDGDPMNRKLYIRLLSIL